MRSRKDYIITKDEVHGLAHRRLSAALRLEYQGTKCTADTVIQILLIAASRVVSLFAACRDLADAPSDQCLRNALAASLTEKAELERRLNLALVTELPRALRRKARVIAIDLTLIPYHGQPCYDEKEIYRSSAGGKRRSTAVIICVSSKSFLHKRSRRRRSKKLLYAVWKIRLSPRKIRETCRMRFGIETRYRQMNEARIRTCRRDPLQRLLFIDIALVLRNVWVWLHFKLAKGKWDTEPQLFLELLRFKEMLLWISQVVGRLLHDEATIGIKYEAYERLAAQVT